MLEVLQNLDMSFINSIVTHLAPIFIATSPITSYADQIYSIHRTRSSSGFSLDIPLIMLVASILKVYYWFGARFSTSLLVQAVLMIGVHLLLLHVALTHRPPFQTHPFAHAAQPKPRPYSFWQWRSTKPYWGFIAYFSVVLLVLHVMFSSTGIFIPYTNLLGYIALAIEATLPWPQLLANYRRRGCKGFRFSVCVNWIIGDTFKMWFFFASSAGEVPLAFKICGCFQALCDLGLGLQFWMWGDGPEEDMSKIADRYEMNSKVAGETGYTPEIDSYGNPVALGEKATY
ncbi:hypothetical protein BU24DRAFT_17795 [Aaosphaeria arxii CBS 175.79]|uniref:PQ loop repeat protein n=1 Tax=Aaosphaeria arxii CBS 175.79 TaxID=1450172 RepID=A0A6A5Y895_9PLEO|nr:uncharacterized protein BU24DRAFT_17795 [Aaosphaeria arxii CBS 175.79]KAF2021247.1 hypothetical protein BU24DRAFT_17795 [Aaosphaeria arxii CBS 175.79]